MHADCLKLILFHNKVEKKKQKTKNEDDLFMTRKFIFLVLCFLKI